MARVIVGNDQLFNAVLYGEPQASTKRFLRKQYEDAESMAGFSDRFISRTKSLFEDFYDSDLASRTRAALRKVRTAFIPDDYRELRTIGEIQNARPLMRNLLMANPVIRELFQKQRIEGYAHHYQDRYEGWRTEDIPEYQQVMSGIEEVQDDGSVMNTIYLDVEHKLHEHIDLDHQQQFDGYFSWHHAKELIRAGKEDPTSPVNARL